MTAQDGDLAGVIVRIADLRAARICRLGARRWLRGHGGDWRAFVRDGIPAAELMALAKGDAQAARLVEVARGRK